MSRPIVAVQVCSQRQSSLPLCRQVDSELCHNREALSRSEDARIAAEGRLPEIEVLQAQLSAAHEELSDLRYAKEQETAAAAQHEAAAQQTATQLEAQLQVRH